MLRAGFFLMFMFVFTAVLPAEEEVKWNVEKSTHFIIYYKNAPHDFVKELVNYSEDYYNKIADGLGFRRFDFWLWDNRAKIYIYDDREDYNKSTGFSPWSAGFAVIHTKTIHTYPYAKGFFETILPHEMGHIVFREFIGFSNRQVPVWLDEGVASFQERNRAESASQIVRAAIKNGTYIPLTKLNSMDPRIMADQGTVSLFYAESVSVVYYLVKQFGKDSFIVFCQRLRDGKTLQESLRSTYSIKDMDELNSNFIKYLGNGR